MAETTAVETSARREDGDRSAIQDHLAAEIGVGTALHEAGRLGLALGRYRRASALAPAFLPAIGSVGLVELDRGARDAAIWCRCATALDPYSVAALHNLALAERGAKVRTLRRILSLDPAHAEGGRMLAGLDRERGDLYAAVARLRRARAAAPLSAALLVDLGQMRGRLSRNGAAAGFFQAAMALAPNVVAVINAIGAHAKALDDAERAAILFRRGLAIDDRHPALWGNLGFALLRKSGPSVARPAFCCAIALGPNGADAVAGLASVENARRNDARAIALSCRAVALSPSSAVSRSIRASIERSRGRLSDATRECRRILAHHPDDATSLMTLGTAYLEMRMVCGAVIAYGRTLACCPQYLDAERNLLYALLHLPDVTEDELFRAAVASARRHQPPVEHRPPPPRTDPAPDRRLRVGYVSSDFRDHPNRWFMNALFEHRDPLSFRVVCYSASRQTDRETEWIRERVDGWREVEEMSDAALAGAMRADAVDIAVFLGGRFDGNRPMVAAYNAAPVQVSYLDGGTSGIDDMHYWMSDDVLHPAGRTSERFTEDLVRLPHFYCFTRPMPGIDVGPLPALGRNGLTFGSFAQPARVTDDVVRVWAQILTAVPGSRLLLKSRNRYGDVANRRGLTDRFVAQGIAADRIAIDAAIDDHVTHLGRYGKVDIALDTFPFSGATTNFEALWMGVPVVTLPGTRFVARMGASILSTIGMPELIAASREDYVQIATALAQDIQRLAGIRRDLRARILASPISDGTTFARSVEVAYRTMWRQWCRRQGVDAPERSRS